MKDDLRTEFGQLGEQALAVSQEDPSRINVEEMSAAEQEQMSDADRRLRRLRLMKKRGRLTDSGLQIEAEKILRDKIEGAPAFEREFRQLASSTLGYDPTGATVQTMFGMATQEPEEQEPIPDWLKGTDFGRDVMQVLQQQQLGLIGEDQANQAIRDVSDTHNTNRALENIQAELELGSLSAERYSNKFLQLGTQQVHKDIFRSMFYEEGPNGELQPRESVDATEIQQTIVGRKSQLVDTLRRNLVESGHTITNEMDKNIRERVDRQFEDIESLAENRDLLERISRDSDILQNAFEIEAAKIAPVLKMADTLGVSAEYMNLLKTPDAYRRIARELMPGLDSAGEIADMPNEIHTRVGELLGGQIDWRKPNEREAHSDALDSLVGGGDSESQESALKMLQRTGKPAYNISNYAKEEFAKPNIRPENQEEYGEFLNLQANTINDSDIDERVRDAIATFDDAEFQRAEVRIEDGKMRVVIQEKQTVDGPWQDAATPGSVANEVNKINAVHAAAQNGWGSDIEAWSPNWLEQWQDRILQRNE